MGTPGNADENAVFLEEYSGFLTKMKNAQKTQCFLEENRVFRGPGNE